MFLMAIMSAGVYVINYNPEADREKDGDHCEKLGCIGVGPSAVKFREADQQTCQAAEAVEESDHLGHCRHLH